MDQFLMRPSSPTPTIGMYYAQVKNDARVSFPPLNGTRYLPVYRFGVRSPFFGFKTVNSNNGTVFSFVSFCFVLFRPEGSEAHNSTPTMRQRAVTSRENRFWKGRRKAPISGEHGAGTKVLGVRQRIPPGGPAVVSSLG